MARDATSLAMVSAAVNSSSQGVNRNAAQPKNTTMGGSSA